MRKTKEMTNRFAELIEKQHWSKLGSHVKDINPNELFQQLIYSELDPDLCLRYYKSLNVSVSLEEDRFGDVEFVYKEMIRRKIQPNVFTFNVALCKMNKAKDVIEDMVLLRM